MTREGAGSEAGPELSRRSACGLRVRFRDGKPRLEGVGVGGDGGPVCIQGLVPGAARARRDGPRVPPRAARVGSRAGGAVRVPRGSSS